MTTTFKRCLWLVNKLTSRGSMTFRELQNEWRDSSLNDIGKELALRTFHDHEDLIFRNFGISIKCNVSDGYRYYIDKGTSDRQDEIIDWLIQSFNVSSLVEEAHDMKDRVILENIPGGAEFLDEVVKAMKEHRKLSVEYQPYGKDVENFDFSPYAMKVFKQRWYLIGQINDELNDNGKVWVKNIALDRVKSLYAKDEKFQIPKDFSAKAYFKNSFGIWRIENGEPEPIDIRVYDPVPNYWKSLPLHESQQEKGKGKDYTDFHFYMCVTNDFVHELMGWGSKVEVLKPQSLREKIAKYAQEMVDFYKK